MANLSIGIARIALLMLCLSWSTSGTSDGTGEVRQTEISAHGTLDEQLESASTLRLNDLALGNQMATLSSLGEVEKMESAQGSQDVARRYVVRREGGNEKHGNAQDTELKPKVTQKGGTESEPTENMHKAVTKAKHKAKEHKASSKRANKAAAAAAHSEQPMKKVQQRHAGPIDMSTIDIPEIHLIEDDTVVTKDHLCGGPGAHEVERYPGPVERTLIQCRQACMDDGLCFYYAYWPQGDGGKNVDGECRNNCRLYDKCSQHEGHHEQVDVDKCRAYVFKMGPKTIAARPDYAKLKIENGTPPVSAVLSLTLALTGALLAFF